MSSAADHAGPVLFFDGDCGLCQRLVRLLLRLDRRGVLRFAPLQGPTAQAYLRTHGLPADDFDSLIFVPAWAQRNERAYLQRTDGAAAALRVCGGAALGLSCFSLLPESWRDRGYRLVARWRHRIFGPWRARPLARPEWAERFWP